MQSVSPSVTRPWRATFIYFVLNASGMTLATANLLGAQADAVTWLQIRHAANPQLYGTAGGWAAVDYLLLGGLGVLLIALASVGILYEAQLRGLAALAATFVLAVALLWDINVSLSVCTGCDGGFPNPISTELNRAGEFLGLVALVSLGGIAWFSAEGQRAATI